MAYEIEKISEGNVDTPLTNFPVGEDTFPRMSDVSVTLLPLVLQYNNYYQNGQLALAQQLLAANPELDACLHNAEKWNMIRDAIIAMQRFLLNQVDSLYNEVAQNAIGVNDNPTAEQMSVVSYSAAKVDSLLSDVESSVENISNQFSNVDNTADADKSVKYATSAGSADTAMTLNGLTSTITELNYVDGVTSNIQTQLDGKQTTVTGGASTITENNLTTNRTLISDENGKVTVSAITSTELGCLDNIASNIQTQLDDKWSSSATRTKNTVLAAPNGSDGKASFRTLVAADIPSLAASKISAGTLAGKVVANATAVNTISDKQLRNIFIGTEDSTASSVVSKLANGDIYLQYE